MRNLIQNIKRAAYRRQLQHLRNYLSVGDRVLVIRGQETYPGVVLNVRRYAHGLPEAWVQCDNFRFAGWVGLDAILPEEGV